MTEKYSWIPIYKKREAAWKEYDEDAKTIEEDNDVLDQIATRL